MVGQARKVGINQSCPFIRLSVKIEDGIFDLVVFDSSINEHVLSYHGCSMVFSAIGGGWTGFEFHRFEIENEQFVEGVGVDSAINVGVLFILCHSVAVVGDVGCIRI